MLCFNTCDRALREEAVLLSLRHAFAYPLERAYPPHASRHLLFYGPHHTGTFPHPTVYQLALCSEYESSWYR
jgi:hypothetical protein